MTRFLLIDSFLLANSFAAAAEPTVHLTVNGVQLSEGALGRIRAAYGTVIPGDFWYDPVSGLFGVIGGGPFASLAPGLDFGAPVPAHASGTGSGAYLNGREISMIEVLALGGYVIPGRYFLRADGWWGVEGGMTLGRVGASPNGGQNGWSGNSSFWVNRSGTAVGGSGGGCTYIATEVDTLFSPGC